MAKKAKKTKRIPAVWKKAKAKASPLHMTSGWELTWGDDHPGRVWPSECPECGKRLEVQIPGTVCCTFIMEKDGEIGKKTELDDIDLFYENPTFICSDSKCNFEYEVEG